MISILLAEAVLDQQGRISTVQDSGNELTLYGKESEFLGTYNIYELANKCKEWARLKGRSLRSNPSWDDCKKYECDDRDYDDMPMFIEYTEPEVIFKACQWILDNK